MDDITIIKNATVARFREVARDYQAAQADIAWHQEAITGAQARLTDIQSRAQLCYSTAALFGFDLIAEVAAGDAMSEAAPAVPAPPPAAPARPRTIKDFIIEAAQQAYPNSVRSSRLRRQLEDQGLAVHIKTVGMTLYRLSREGSIRREGLDWFFVPEVERKLSPEEERPGGDPGLFGAAE